MSRFGYVVLAGTLAAAGCGGTMVEEAIASARPGPAKAKVSDEHFARIPVEYLTEVERMREEVRQRRDARVRVEHEVSVGEQSVKVADARVTAAMAQEQVADEALELAKKKGDRGRIEDARALVERRKAERQLAEANAEVARRRHGAAEAEVDLANARVAVTEAQLEEAKYAALVASNDAAADRYDAEEFRRPIDDAQQQLRRFETALRRAEDGVREAVARADSLEQDLERVPVRGQEDSILNPPELEEEEEIIEEEDVDPIPAPTPFR